jgi:hypothetical protein
MAVYRGNSGSIMYDGVIIGAVREWRLLIVANGDEARWTGSLIWQWLSLTSYDPTDDEYWLELEDGSATPSYRLSGTTVFTAIDRERNTLHFQGHGDLAGVPDPGPGQSEITIT